MEGDAPFHEQGAYLASKVFPQQRLDLYTRLSYSICHQARKTLAMAEGGVSVIRGVSLEEQLSKFPAHLLDRPCDDAHLVQLTECFSEWQTHLATSLQLTPVEVEDI